MIAEQQAARAREEKQSIKCVVWDLDNTIWDGILLEDAEVALRAGVLETIRELDGRGILNSIASRNDRQLAMDKLKSFGLGEYFLYPEINWNSKAASLEAIARALNIGLDTFAFVDDQPFEREEVAFLHPEVLCVDTADIHRLLDMPCFMPRFITPESRLRRQMYQSDSLRATAESEFAGSNEEFLATLNMVFTIKLLLMSCRVMSRGVGTIMISYIMSRAGRDGARLRAHFIPNGRNRMIYVTYKFGGFKEVEKDGDLVILEHDLSQIQPFPAYLQVQIVKRQ